MCGSERIENHTTLVPDAGNGNELFKINNSIYTILMISEFKFYNNNQPISYFILRNFARHFKKPAYSSII